MKVNEALDEQATLSFSDRRDFFLALKLVTHLPELNAFHSDPWKGKKKKKEKEKETRVSRLSCTRARRVISTMARYIVVHVVLLSVLRRFKPLCLT